MVLVELLTCPVYGLALATALALWALWLGCRRRSSLELWTVFPLSAVEQRVLKVVAPQWFGLWLLMAAASTVMGQGYEELKLKHPGSQRIRI
ncbi:hypothetical protein JRQ81_012777 [Phrynocephalus forsythii]|uniref:Uncharacterized protein n=1 Tax=Phrynocephalus forsythii TaxID=171643 RepID=A0A9Q0Y1S3_9SAUR|nr:hypothetical protein JRQ81_012777 [Phrynocephalus forsythii]